MRFNVTATDFCLAVLRFEPDNSIIIVPEWLKEKAVLANFYFWQYLNIFYLWARLYSLSLVSSTPSEWGGCRHSHSPRCYAATFTPAVRWSLISWKNKPAVGEKVTDSHTLFSALTNPVLPVTLLGSDGFPEGSWSPSKAWRCRPESTDLVYKMRGNGSYDTVKVARF